MNKYKLEITFYDFEMVVKHKNILWMHDNPGNADLYLCNNNLIKLQRLRENIQDNTEVELLFNREYFNELPEIDAYAHDSDEKEVKFDLVMYGSSNEDKTNCLEDYIENLKKQNKINFSSLKIEFKKNT